MHTNALVHIYMGCVSLSLSLSLASSLPRLGLMAELATPCRNYCNSQNEMSLTLARPCQHETTETPVMIKNTSATKTSAMQVRHKKNTVTPDSCVGCCSIQQQLLHLEDIAQRFHKLQRKGRRWCVDFQPSASAFTGFCQPLACAGFLLLLPM